MHPIDHRLLRDVRERWLETVRMQRPQDVTDAAKAAYEELKREIETLEREERETRACSACGDSTYGIYRVTERS